MNVDVECMNEQWVHKSLKELLDDENCDVLLIFERHCSVYNPRISGVMLVFSLKSLLVLA